MRYLAYVFSFLVWLGSIAAASATTGERVALVIGNAAYDNVAELANPVNDASDLAETLERVGFSVTLVTNADFTAMNRALRDFSNEALGADMALVYFAGHGIEIDKQNFLIPTDAELETDRHVALETISLDLITEAVSGAKTLRMVLIDACRNNPFVNTMTRSVAGRNIGRGLSPMEPTGGTLVAFAAKGGTVAEDGNGRNSPFMSSLLQEIEKPGLDVNLMFRKVRDSVLAATDNRQEPFTYGSLPGEEIFLVPPIKVATIEADLDVPELLDAEEPVKTKRKAPKVDEQEEFAWSLVKDTTEPGALRIFMKTYPDGAHFDEALDKLLALQGGTTKTVVKEAVTEERVIEDEKPATIKTADLSDVRESIADEDVDLVPEFDLRSVTLDIQEELKRAGCNPGRPDGIWGNKSRKALAAFERDGNISIASTEPTPEVLEQLQSVKGTVCVQVEVKKEPKKREATKKETKKETAAKPAKKKKKVHVVEEEEDHDSPPVKLKFGRHHDDDDNNHGGGACIGIGGGFGGGSISFGNC